MAEDATAAKPKSVSRLGPLCSHHQPLLSADPRTTPNALPPLRRHHPREEPGALAAHAGIRAGGGEQSSSLPRPSRNRAESSAAAFTRCRANANIGRFLSSHTVLYGQAAGVTL